MGLLLSGRMESPKITVSHSISALDAGAFEPTREPEAGLAHVQAQRAEAEGIAEAEGHSLGNYGNAMPRGKRAAFNT